MPSVTPARTNRFANQSPRSIMANQLISQRRPVMIQPPASSGFEDFLGAIPLVGSIVGGISGILEADERKREAKRQQQREARAALANVIARGPYSGFGMS